ncbi:nuclear pore complex protein Nup133 [Drosophila grimshawi]|uniref:GH19208 n=1 Tax=Drosophila grimshawi TaxID=7222 RepID=B4JRZ7_DROGR|nr:nuclear pore complex protein Nup133 [Drosophila grimshawi]EDV94537.1 GH19208 [Drosophila grimshawi]
MDRNMQKQLFNKARESPNLRRFSTSATADSTRKSFFGGNPNLGASPGALKKTGLSNSRLSLSGRSTSQSIPGIRSDYNVVEIFGNPLPVAVNEALTFTGTMGNTVSAKIAQNGYAWVVQGRRLLIWQYRNKSGAGQANSPPRLGKRGATSAQCRELTLPHSDIGHKSELVSVFQTEDSQAMASCIAVSATGDVRYWASIAHDNNSVDLSILTGQEFVQLLNLPTQQGYLAVTSTCTLVFLRVGLSKGRYTLHHKTIKPATSLLGGFGKRVASMLIGMNNGGDRDQLLVGMCCESNTKNGESIVTVLSDRGLQRWLLSNKGNTEQLIYEEVELLRKMREMLLLNFWNVRTPNENVDVELHFMDYHVANNYHYMLVGAVNHGHAPQMNYAIMVASAGPERMLLDCLTPLKLQKFYSAKTVQECLSVRIMVGASNLYLYTPKVVYPLGLVNLLPTGENEMEKVEFHLHEDRILSAAMCNRIPLFFSRTHGLVGITPGNFEPFDMMNLSNLNPSDVYFPFDASFNVANQSMSQENSNCLPMYQLDPDEVYADFNNGVGQLKAAFLYRLKRNNQMVKTVLADVMDSIAESDPKGAPLDAYKLDRIVITIAEDLAEDLPIGDPRWQSAIEEYDGERYALGSSHSMQIIHQLRDKGIAFQHFIDFLHFSALWEKLNAIPCGSNVLKHTSYILADISEKIVAATALRALQSKMPKLIDEVIDFTVAHWDEKPYESLTAQDIFYVKLCKFQCIYMALADMADDRIASQDRTTAMVAQFIADINTIVLGTLGPVLRHREQNASSFKPPANSCENQPWTATVGSAGCHDSLVRLIDITVRYGAQCVTESELKHVLYQQILELMDMVLEGRKNYLDSVRGTEKFQVLQQQFESQRRELISVLIKDQQYECASRLAEKYLDFQSLVVICDETQDNERLDEFTRKYEEHDFSQFAINWHLRQNRHGEVFERFKSNQPALAQFMRDHPSLGWIQLIFNGNHERAAKVLFDLAQGESEFVARKKSMLSLSKLSALAAPDADLSAQVEKINSELAIIEYQSYLAHNVLQSFGFDANDQKVLKVEEIINLFIAEENDSATEVEFRKALELLNYVDQAYDLRHKIWCAAIRRDNWTDYDANNAVNYIHNLLFFKIIEISQLIGQDTDGFLPPMEDFLESMELGDLPQQQTFQYLLKLAYEYVGDLFKQTEDMEL